MGPVRRGLILASLPSSAWAEVCDKLRPAWDGTAATPLTEALALFATLPALVLSLATMLVIRRQSVWGGLAVVLGWSSLLTVFVSWDRDGLRAAAREEGCIGDPVLFIGAVIVICAITLFFTAPRNAPPANGDS